MVGVKGNGSASEIPRIISAILKKRGIEGDKALTDFLFPKLSDLPHPEEMRNLVDAAICLGEYVVRQKKVFIWGDYDVDGTTGVALLVNFLRELGTEPYAHIPNRFTEGYGLNLEWFDENNILESGKDRLLITVDCGISNAREIAVLKEYGWTIIVTDHHSLPKDDLPDCIVVNPAHPDCGFHDHKLAGVGVAFYLAAALRGQMMKSQSKNGGIEASKINMKPYLAFVALGTVSDLVDLTQVNRILVRGGLEALADTDFVGIKGLLAACDVNGGTLSTEDIGFLVGPRINAAGRLGNSKLVIQLFTQSDPKGIKGLLAELEEIHGERKAITAEDFEKALSTMDGHLIQKNRCCIAAGNFHQGVAGIVASRLTESFGVPSVVFAKIKKKAGFVFTGSIRSIEGINIVGVLHRCAQWIDKYGGHQMAAGLSVSEENFESFRKQFVSIVQKEYEDYLAKKVSKKSQYDLECSVTEFMSKENLKYYSLLEPFGNLNPQPVLLDKNAKIINSMKVGKEAIHLSLVIRGKYVNYKGIGFGLGEKLSEIQQDSTRAMRFTPTINRYRGTESWQVRVIDL